MKINLKLSTLIIITILLALGFMGVMVKMIADNSRCVDNPFIFSAEKLNKSGGNYACSCQSLDEELLSFAFDQEGINIIKPIDYGEINYSNLKIIEEKGGK